MNEAPWGDGAIPVEQYVLDRSLPALPMPGWKRAMDVVGAIAGLVFLAPVFALIALIVWLGSPGPVFFRQERVGLRGRMFAIWKFRTMHAAADAGAHRRYVQRLRDGDGRLEKIDHEYRLIPLGRWLRTLALDELPQLLNVLQGEMSLVGPRPDVLAFDEYEPWQQARFGVVPGMTGLWQVSGKNETTFEEMILLDLEYVRRRSFWTDVKILLRTGPALASQARTAWTGRRQAALPLTSLANEMEGL
jgi:lipopolysaccharide/colanic/teichoic acid biosynthesis glycosyltransferase